MRERRGERRGGEGKGKERKIEEREKRRGGERRGEERRGEERRGDDHGAWACGTVLAIEFGIWQTEVCDATCSILLAVPMGLHLARGEAPLPS